MWTEIRPFLHPIEEIMSFRVKKTVGSMKNEQDVGTRDDSKEEFYDLERSESDTIQDVPPTNNKSALGTGVVGDIGPPESLLPWKEELEILVQGGLPMELRGYIEHSPVFSAHRCQFCFLYKLHTLFQLQLWQAFVGMKSLHVEKYYQDLLPSNNKSADNTDNKNMESEDSRKESSANSVSITEKWEGQIEKVILLWMKMEEMH